MQTIEWTTLHNGSRWSIWPEKRVNGSTYYTLSPVKSESYRGFRVHASYVTCKGDPFPIEIVAVEMDGRSDFKTFQDAMNACEKHKARVSAS